MANSSRPARIHKSKPITVDNYLYKTLKRLLLRPKKVKPVTCRNLYQDVTEDKRNSRIGSYTVEETLGKGSFGYVRAATSILGEKVAIKAIKRGPKGYQDKVNVEVLIMKRLGRHPNIMGTTEAMLSNTHYYIVMPRANMDLQIMLLETDLLNSQPDLRKEAVKGILSGLYQLHRRGIAHLDLKLENIMVTTNAIDKDRKLIPGHRLDSSCFQLTDFGVSKSKNFKTEYDRPMAPEQAKKITKPVGTCHYMAPELVVGEPCPDGRLADMWSVGCVFLFLVSDKQDCPSDWFEKVGRKFCKMGVAAGKRNKNQRNKNHYLRLVSKFLIALGDFSNRLEKNSEGRLYVDFVMRFLTSGRKRITADQALQHKLLEHMSCVPLLDFKHTLNNI